MSSDPQTIEINLDNNDGEGVDIGRKHKLGHLRVDQQGNATFKRLPTNQLVEALQHGIQYTIGGLETRPAHDVLIHDFATIEIIHFPKEGRTTPKATPAHRFNDFTICSYAPLAFRYFRERFNIKPEDFLSSICQPLRELKNPGASGSLFYLTSDDQFILKTVQRKEASFLKSLLPGYYMNLTQNPRTLLPKFFGLYCYQMTELLPRNKPGTSGENKNIRITVMNNLIPSHLQMHEKYDLKGSRYKRRANNAEREKESPTWKDLDFIERHPNGLVLDAQTYQALKHTVERDCRVLESFHIMDYSFLVCIHQIDSLSDSTANRTLPNGLSTDAISSQPKRLLYSTPMDNIQAHFDKHNKPDDFLAQTGGIPARDENGQRLSLYVGIIDILQSYQLKKKLEHAFKSVITDGNQISVTHPKLYSERFKNFLFNNVFKQDSPLRDPSNKQTEKSSKHNSLTTNEPKFNENYRSRSTTARDQAEKRLGEDSSIGTMNSRISSYYSSLRSNGDSERTNHYSSSQALYASSRQSDSLYNTPIQRLHGKVMTSQYQTAANDGARMKFYQNYSVNDWKKTEYDRNLANEQNDNCSYYESTRL